MCILEKLNFKISRGSMPPGPSIETVPSALDHIIAGPTLNYFRWACYYQWVIVSIILRILITQKHFSFFTRKRCYGAPEGTRKLKSFEWLDCTNNKVLNVAIAQTIKFLRSPRRDTQTKKFRMARLHKQ